jgi:hypoxanthine phosphoribosyltransferase
MPELTPILEKGKISTIVAGPGRKISFDYQNKVIILIGILKGSFLFLVDLMRHLTAQVKVDFIGDSRYGSGTFSSEKYRKLSSNYHMNILTGAH